MSIFLTMKRIFIYVLGVELKTNFGDIKFPAAAGIFEVSIFELIFA